MTISWQRATKLLNIQIGNPYSRIQSYLAFRLRYCEPCLQDHIAYRENDSYIPSMLKRGMISQQGASDERSIYVYSGGAWLTP